MDIAVDMAAPAVEWAPVARTMMEQLSAPEQAAVQGAIARLSQDFDASRVTAVTPVRPGQQPFFVLRATPALRVFFVRAADRLRVLDVVGAEELAYFRDDAGAPAH